MESFNLEIFRCNVCRTIFVTVINFILYVFAVMYYAVKVSWNKVPYPVLSVNDCIPSFAGQHAAKETMIINSTSDSVTCLYTDIPPSWTVYPIPKLFQTMLHRDCSSISASIIHLCNSVTWLCPISVLFRWFDYVFARFRLVPSALSLWCPAL